MLMWSRTGGFWQSLPHACRLLGMSHAAWGIPELHADAVLPISRALPQLHGSCLEHGWKAAHSIAASHSQIYAVSTVELPGAEHVTQP